MKLKDIILGTKRERIFTESTTIGGIICPLIKINHWDVYLYGAGTDIESIILYLWNLGIDVKGVFDCDIQKKDRKVLEHVSIIYPYDLKNKFDSKKTFVLINTVCFKGIEQGEILELLFNLGITKFYEITEYEKMEMKAKPRWVDIGRIEYYREHIEELEKTYNILYDKKSKEIMMEFVRTYIEFGSYRLKQCSGNIKYFYAQNNDGSLEELYTHLKEEVWLNCGSNVGDNIFWYFANGLTAKYIFAYEGDTKIYERLIKNLNYLPKDCLEKVYAINEFIDVETKWELLKTNKVTLINADIEGGELDLLKNLKDIILLARPVLAICVYHKAEDLVEIPEYIKQIVNDYYFILRKYESNVENIRRTAELVLYAIPEERMSCTDKKE